MHSPLVIATDNPFYEGDLLVVIIVTLSLVLFISYALRKYLKRQGRLALAIEAHASANPELQDAAKNDNLTPLLVEDPKTLASIADTIGIPQEEVEAIENLADRPQAEREALVQEYAEGHAHVGDEPHPSPAHDPEVIATETIVEETVIVEQPTASTPDLPVVDSTPIVDAPSSPGYDSDSSSSSGSDSSPSSDSGSSTQD